MDAPAFAKKVNDVAADFKHAAAVRTFVDALVDGRLALFKEQAEKAKQLATELSDPAKAPASATPAPAALIAAIDSLRAESIKFLEGLTAIRVLLIARTPEIKEEDNAGVTVQGAIADVVDSYSDALSGVSSKKDSSSGLSLVPITFKKEYLTARVAAEEKVHKPTCKCGPECRCGADGKDCGCNMSKETASSPSLLGQIDVDAAFKVSVGFTRLYQAGLQLSVGLTRNITKILNPRRSGSAMIG